MDKATRDDLQRLEAEVTNPTRHARWDYYQGNHPRVYATPKLADVFRNLADSLTENYCALTVQTRVDRLQVEGWEGDTVDGADQVWTLSKGPERQDRLYRWAIAQGEAYLIVDTEDQTFTANPATLAAAFPDPDNPDDLAYGGKVWDTGTTTRRAVLYYPDHTLRLAKDGKDWEVVEELPQPLGQVPMIHVRPFGDGPPVLDTVAPIQDRINKITANTMVAAEFGAFRQRVFFTRQQVDQYDVRNAPDHAIVLDPGESGEGQARMQETTATELRNYDDSKNAAIDALFTVAQLPRHLRVNPGSPPSGDAIKADEGPLVQAIREHQREIGEALAQAMNLLGHPGNHPVWRDPEVNNATSNAQVVATLVAAGVPWQMAVKVGAGWTDDMVTEAEQIKSQTMTQGDAQGAAILQAFNVATPAEATEG